MEKEKIKEVVNNIHDKKLDEMRMNVNTVLADKVSQKLEEKKIEIASNYFGIKGKN